MNKHANLVKRFCMILVALLFVTYIPAQAQDNPPPEKPLDRGPLPPEVFVPEGGFSLPDADPELAPVDEAGLAPDFNSWQLLAFQTFRTGNWEIYTSRGLNHVLNISNDPGANDARPSVSREGRRVAFHSNRARKFHIFSVGSDGLDMRQLTSGDHFNYSPRYSSDASKIVFLSNRHNPEKTNAVEVYMMNADGSEVTQLTFDGSKKDSPSWSPDGKKVVFVTYDGPVGAIMTLDIGTGELDAITGYMLFLGHPTWSPDGKRIAFDADINNDTWNDLAVINSDGTGLKLLYSPGVMLDAWAGEWSTDGNEVCMTIVQYILHQNAYYIKNIELYSYMVYVPKLVRISASNLDALPSWQSLDPYPPVSNILPLPEYSPASGFPLYWTGYDVGPSKISRYFVQYRKGSGGAWTDYSRSDYDIEISSDFPFASADIDTYYFRMAGLDYAENREPWPPGDGDAWTRLYSSLFTMFGHDERGFLLPNLQLDISPEAWETGLSSGPTGKLLAHLKTKGQHKLSASHNGYTPVVVNRSLIKDDSLSLHLGPLDDRIQNGGFENDLDSWSITGTLTASIAPGYSQANSVRLGQLCPAPCLAPKEQPYEANIYSFPQGAYDKHGNLHVVWDMEYYSFRNASGVWSPTETLGKFEPCATVDQNRVRIAVDSQKTVHVIVLDGEGFSYLRKPFGGAWSAKEKFSSGYSPNLAIGSDGSVYVSFAIYFDPGLEKGLYFRRRLPNGTWQAPVRFSQSSSSILVDLAAGAGGILHLLYRDEDQAYYAAYGSSGLIQRILLFGNSPRAFPVALHMDSTGRLHMLANVSKLGESARYAYISRSAQGKWSEITPLGELMTNASTMVVDISGNVHIFGMVDTPPRILYAQLPAGSGEIKYKTIHLQNVFSLGGHPSATSGPNNQLSLIYSDGNYVTIHSSQTASENAFQEMSQPVDLSGVINPTLAYMYARESYLDWNQSSFEVLITAGEQISQVVQTSANAAWQHDWVDLSPWAGQAITVTFRLNQAAGELIANLLLDNISLGSWLTPVPEQVSPTAFEGDWAGQEITIQGQNFQQTPGVHLGGIPLTGVTWIDEQTLLASLPPGLPPGSYPLIVTNPGGQQGVLPEAMNLGRIVYLPLMRK